MTLSHLYINTMAAKNPSPPPAPAPAPQRFCNTPANEVQAKQIVQAFYQGVPGHTVLGLTCTGLWNRAREIASRVYSVDMHTRLKASHLEAMIHLSVLLTQLEEAADVLDNEEETELRDDCIKCIARVSDALAMLHREAA